MEVPTTRPTDDTRTASSNDGDINEHVLELIFSLSKSKDEKLKEILRDLTLQCSSSPDLCILLIREHIVEKITILWRNSDDQEIKNLCVQVLHSIGIMNEKSVNLCAQNNLTLALIGLVQSEEQTIMEAGTTELCSLLEKKERNEEDIISIEMILGLSLGILHQQRPPNKSSEEQRWKNKICSAIKISTSALKGGFKSEQLFNIKDIINKFIENDDEDIDIIAAQSAFIAIWKKIIPQNSNKKSNDQLSKENQDLKSELQIINKSSIWQLIAKVLSLKLEGNEIEQQQIIQRQEEVGNLLIPLFISFDEITMNKAIKSGIIEALLNILNTRDLNLIKDTFITAFETPTVYSSNNNILMYYFNLHPYPVLLRLFNHPNVAVVHGSIIAINNILTSGITSQISQPHQHSELMLECDGINKIFALFQQTEIEETKNQAAICIGRLFKSREIENRQMRSEIIAHLKTMINNDNQFEKNESRFSLKYLAQNAVNRAEIEADGFIIPEPNAD
ncbi:MAG: hypothetical protein EZS28_021419 [Streblomastix strix]|uniref:Uncharacterized protein n=1 Tax=Streblomastix strix TaxID=222440 RepID=A0A5J4VLG0_9EUKA|nr:MAG: hypothetical protein EZS28_021419 [Streblomastix strix]